MIQISDDIRNVHVAASDIDGQLLLLHKISDGAASSSFGLHVAKMAGIPAAVLEEAKQYLNRTLPNQSAILNHDKIDLANSLADKSESADSQETEHLDDIVEAPLHDYVDNQKQNQMLSLHDQLTDIDPDGLTPKQAHDILYELKAHIKS